VYVNYEEGLLEASRAYLAWQSSDNYDQRDMAWDVFRARLHSQLVELRASQPYTYTRTTDHALKGGGVMSPPENRYEVAGALADFLLFMDEPGAPDEATWMDVVELALPADVAADVVATVRLLVKRGLKRRHPETKTRKVGT
jgi:hypothetical protein